MFLLQPHALLRLGMGSGVSVVGLGPLLGPIRSRPVWSCLVGTHPLSKTVTAYQKLDMDLRAIEKRRSDVSRGQDKIGCHGYLREEGNEEGSFFRALKWLDLRREM